MMEKPNFQRMILLAESIFNSKNDDRQIAFTDEDMEQMQNLHPHVMNEAADENGPFSWVTILPTSKENMLLFLDHQMNEKELLQNTTAQTPFECLYLCSALTLPEYRNKNATFHLTLSAITAISIDHPIQSLFAWPFSESGRQLCEKISKTTQLPVHFK